VILKSYIVENNLDCLEQYFCTLMHGENEGIKDDIKENYLKRTNKVEKIVLFQEDILKNKNILYDHIFNTSLFNDNKLVIIHEVSDKIYNEINDIINCKNKSIRFLLIAGILDKKSKIRKMFETKKELATFACYKDNERTLNNYVRNLLINYKGLSQETVNLIISNSNLDRKLIKNEVKKIIIFFSDKVIIKNQLEELLNIKSNSEFDQIRDAVLMGEKIKTNKLMNEIEFVTEKNFYYINSLSYRVSKLIEIKNFNTSDYETAVESIKPKIFWKDKPTYINQLKKWKLKDLKIALNKIAETELSIKKNSHIRGDILMKQLLITLSSQITNAS